MLSLKLSSLLSFFVVFWGKRSLFKVTDSIQLRVVKNSHYYGSLCCRVAEKTENMTGLKMLSALLSPEEKDLCWFKICGSSGTFPRTPRNRKEFLAFSADRSQVGWLVFLLSYFSHFNLTQVWFSNSPWLSDSILPRLIERSLWLRMWFLFF